MTKSICSLYKDLFWCSAVPSAHDGRGAGQHNRPVAHVPRLPALPHQVQQGVRALAHARQGRRTAQGAQPRAPAAPEPRRTEDHHVSTPF